MILFLTPNGNTYTWGIGFLETLCKVMKAIINTRMRASFIFHDILHGFHAGRGTGTAIL